MSTSGEVYQTLYEAVDEYAETARLASTATVDQVVGAAALARSQGDVAAARAELSERFGMPRDRARLAIDAADGVLTSAGRSVIERVCALRLSRDAVSVITSLTDRGATAVLPRVKGLSPAAVRRKVAADAVEEILDSANVDDVATALVTAALIEQAGATADQLLEALAVTTPHEADDADWSRDRIVLTSYALSTVRHRVLDLGSEDTFEGPTEWLARAAPWVLPLIGGDNAALRTVLEAVAQAGFDFVPPSVDPFRVAAPPTWVEEVRATATSLAEQLTIAPEWPVAFDGGDGGVRVILAEDDEVVVAWVGVGTSGLLVGFDPVSFAPIGAGEFGVPYAVGVAISWYLDCCIRLEKPALSRSGGWTGSSSGRRSVVRYTPTPRFLSHLDHVGLRVVDPPRPHMVAAHIRRLTDRWPNNDHVAEAPLRLWRRMGPRDTWVRAHQRGVGNPTFAAHRLSTHSALADALGLLRRRVG